MDKPRIQLSHIAVAVSLLCAGLAVLTIEHYVDASVAPLWLVPRVFGCSIAGAGLGYAVGQLLAGRRGALIGSAAGLLLGWNAAILVATATVVHELP